MSDLDPNDTPPQTFGFLLIPQFSTLSLSAAIEPLRSANRLAERPLYRWQVITSDGAAATSSGGIEIVAHAGIGDVQRLANVIVIAGLDAHAYRSKAVLGWLRRLERQGSRIGAVSTASYILARAGLLDGYRCTIHWESMAAFQEEFPDIEVSSEVYEIDRTRFTCSGGTAAIDMMLNMIALEHGRDLAVAVADQFMHERIRDSHDRQRMTLRNRLGIAHPKLLKVVALMEDNLEEPMSRAELARTAGLSTRQLERLFRKYLSRTPTRYYLELRLNRARMLLTQTAMSVLDVALACGFVSASHFSKCYREFFNKTPREERVVSLRA